MFLIIHTLSLIFIVFVFLFLGLLVYLRNKKNITNISFGIFVAITIFWLITNYFADTPTFYSQALLWNKLAFGGGLAMGAIGIPFFLTHFPSKGKLHLFWKLNFVVNSIFLTLLVFTPLIVSRVDFYDWGTNIVSGPLFIPLVIWGSISVLGIFVTFFKKYTNATTWEKVRLKYFVLGFVAFLATSVILGLILPAITGVNNLAKFSPYALVLFIGGTSYSILRHRLLDIRLVVARAVAYVLLTTILFGSYVFVTVLGTSIFFDTTARLEQAVLYGVLTLVVAFTFQPLRRLLQNVTDKFFYKGSYDSSELLSNLTKIMARTLGLNQLMERLIIKILPEMRISKGAFVLLEKGKVEETKIIGFDKKIEFVGTDVISLLDEEKILIVEEVSKQKIKKIMRELDVTISIPLKAGKDEIGVLLLGHKLSGEIYTTQDTKVLDILSPEISIAIQNARSFEEIRKFNITLQKEIEKATADLRDANEKLKELDKLKDEFMSIASHELRTPMTAIKSYIWLALHGKRPEQDPRLRDYLNKVYDSSERMIAMVNDMLNVSRIETGRLQLEIVPVSVYKIAQQVKDDLSARAVEAGVEIIINKEAVVPNVSADTDKLAEIFTNLIGNAIKFTKKEGKITVSTRKVDKVVEVSITDTGIGIAKENIPRLFKKYGKIDESYATVSASTGTGLGLYITKQYLEKMGGGVWVKSIQGKGATFTFSLPVSTGKELSKDHSHEEQPEGVVINPKFLQQTKSKQQEAEG